jgi:uncharacterized protein (DUF1778 family)
MVARIAICYTMHRIAAMPTLASRTPPSTAKKAGNLMVRVDRESKGVITRAAKLRGVSASDYVRSVVVSQARRDIEEQRTRTITMSASAQLAFWQALNAPVSLTRRQKALGRMMRGER